MLPTAKLILAILCGSYLLSAVLLAVARTRGEPVPIAVIATWAVLGIIGFALLPQLQIGRTPVLIALAVVLAPWMAYSLFGDMKGGHWIIAITDVAGLVALGTRCGSCGNGKFDEVATKLRPFSFKFFDLFSQIAWNV